MPPRRSTRTVEWTATALLAAMGAGAVAATLAPLPPGVAGAARAFCEAGFAGGLADWFAVTALFRRPLGLPIPHTAIIPRSQARIGRALGDFIASNFLESRPLENRLAKLAPAARLAAWLETPANAASIARRVAHWSPDLAEAAAIAAEAGAASIRRLLATAPVAGALADLLERVWLDPRCRSLLEAGLAALADYVAAHPELVENGVRARAWKWLPQWAERMLADGVAKGLLGTLRDARQPDHPLRRALDEAVLALVERLRSDPATIAGAERLKSELLNDPTILAAIEDIWRRTVLRLAKDPAPLRESVERLAARALTALGHTLATDEAARTRLDRGLQAALRRIVGPARQAIGEFVAEVVQTWDPADVSRRLERQVKPDLQYIRINGAIVGAFAGLAIYLLAAALAR
ncbi:MAG TPA: DUF445 domain-containing protein [Caulobacteraceae bacterium]|jgi:uncharacterized membrane-anchored protein YjiN (DUF445 family)|nr:DUF445 domain-containing protein [Caulobacteraceae bacterium]